MQRFLINLLSSLCSLCLCGATPLFSQEPPVVGRPANFSGAVGSYRIETKAEPTSVQAEDAVTLTVRVVGTAPLQGVVRPDLRKLPRFEKQFHIENAGERDQPAEKAREYDYRLRPRIATVREIPPLPFVYFKPGLLPLERGYQTAYAPAIPLTVTPRAEVAPTTVQGEERPAYVPPFVPPLTTGNTVLPNNVPCELPGPRVVLFSHALLWLCWTCWLMTRRAWSVRFWIAFFAVGIVSAWFLLIAREQMDDARRHPHVVIAEDGVLLRVGNGFAYPATKATPLLSGLEGRLLYRRGDWLQIELSNKLVGWVPRSAVLLDEP